MNLFFKGILVLVILQANICHAQDTVTYYQTQSPWVSNQFKFCRANKEDKKGVVINTSHSDDGQQWYGYGRFLETHTKIIVKPMKVVRSTYHFDMDGNKSTPVIQDSDIVHTLTFYKNDKELFLKGKQITIFKQRKLQGQ